MYKLTVVAGPNRGTSFPLREGETSIGRQAGNGIVLQSSRVSKRHCVLVVDNTSPDGADGGEARITLQDQNSSNGTFVNGVLTRARELRPGDRIGVGDFVLEISQPPARGMRNAPAVGGFGNVLQFPAGRAPIGGSPALSAPHGAGGLPAPSLGGVPGFGDPNAAAAGAVGASDVAGGPPPKPKDIVGQALWYFETYVMPIFYGFNLKYQWKFICVGVFVGFVLLNLTVSIDPLLEANRNAVIAELGKRARFMAKQIAETNAPYIASRSEGKTDVGLAASAPGVRMAVLVDIENRILAPGSKFNQFLVSGPEARAARNAVRAFQDNRETGMWLDMGDNTWVAVEPLKVAHPQTGKNVVVALALVSMDTEIATMQLGEVSTVYAEVLVITLLLGGVALFIMYRLTLKPYAILAEDLDKALKGDIPQVTHEFKIEELNGVWDLINSALQRIPKSNSHAEGAGGNDSGISADDYLGIAKMISGSGKVGVALFGADKKFVYLNELFEEITGIRGDAARGQEVSSVARDSSLGQFTEDLMGQVTPGGEPVAQTYDFSGQNYSVGVSAVGKPGEPAKGFLFVLNRSDG